MKKILFLLLCTLSPQLLHSKTYTFTNKTDMPIEITINTMNEGSLLSELVSEKLGGRNASQREMKYFSPGETKKFNGGCIQKVTAVAVRDVAGDYRMVERENKLIQSSKDDYSYVVPLLKNRCKDHSFTITKTKPQFKRKDKVMTRTSEWTQPEFGFQENVDIYEFDLNISMDN